MDCASLLRKPVLNLTGTLILCKLTKREKEKDDLLKVTVFTSFISNRVGQRSVQCNLTAHWTHLTRLLPGLAHMSTVLWAYLQVDTCLVPWPGRSTWSEELMNGLLIH